jgi:hypothetical protein
VYFGQQCVFAGTWLQVNISLIIESKDAQRAVKALHKEFFEGQPACAPKTPQLAGAANGNGNGKA